MSLKIVTIIGARPQFVKAAVVSRAYVQRRNIQEIIIHTGQHYDSNMSEIFFEEMQIPKPSYNLNINGNSHGSMTGQMLERIETILISENPDWVVVYGDTNSTLAGALAAKKINLKIAHIEGGLRDHDMALPEEVNRILTDRISDVIFCPSDVAINNLQKEGFEHFSCELIRTGDVMLDAALYYKNKMQKPACLVPDDFVLCTCHRVENTDRPEILLEIFKGLEAISSQCPVVLPIHPRTKKKLADCNYDFGNSLIAFVDPVGYFEMIWLLEHCKMVITDSGGLQKEASFFNKHGIILSEYTPWEELVSCGYSYLVGTDRQRLVGMFEFLLDKPFVITQNLYGDGHAANQIIDYFDPIKI